MGLWGGLKAFWHWLRNGSGLGVEELARRLGCDPAELTAVVPSYREFTVPKRAGGRRRLSAPDDRLKELQRRILYRLLGRLKCHPAATGFQRGESIVTHARRHAGRAVVVRLDLHDFFPSTKAGRVRRYFRKIGWNRPAARLLIRLCTHHGGLPQGAPTSPRLSNLVNYRLDCRLAAMARKLGAGYSRYADDITLSFPTDDRRQIRYLIRFVRGVAHAEGYRLHGSKKLQIRRRHQQQRVTGLVVNEGVNLPRAVRRRLRAVEDHLRTGRPATLTPEQFAGWRALQYMVAAQAVEPLRREELRQERDRLRGVWVPADAEGPGRRCVFGEDRIVLEWGDVRLEAKYRLGPSAGLGAIDLTPTGGAEQGRTFRGVYALDGGLLRLCLNRGSGKRPTAFADDTGAGWEVLVLKREA
jgi:uncharacterized protein (TIGR03067 family)